MSAKPPMRTMLLLLFVLQSAAQVNSDDCCEALHACCIACKFGLSYQEFCAHSLGFQGCPGNLNGSVTCVGVPTHSPTLSPSVVPTKDPTDFPSTLPSESPTTDHEYFIDELHGLENIVGDTCDTTEEFETLTRKVDTLTENLHLVTSVVNAINEKLDVVHAYTTDNTIDHCLLRDMMWDNSNVSGLGFGSKLSLSGTTLTKTTNDSHDQSNAVALPRMVAGVHRWRMTFRVSSLYSDNRMRWMVAGVVTDGYGNFQSNYNSDYQFSMTTWGGYTYYSLGLASGSDEGLSGKLVQEVEFTLDLANDFTLAVRRIEESGPYMVINVSEDTGYYAHAHLYTYSRGNKVTLCS